MTTIRALIFDFDGLILETEGSYFAAWRELFRAHGNDYTLEEYLLILGSGESPRTLFELRCAIRESMLAWIREHQPKAIARQRTDAAE